MCSVYGGGRQILALPSISRKRHTSCSMDGGLGKHLKHIDDLSCDGMWLWRWKSEVWIIKLTTWNSVKRMSWPGFTWVRSFDLKELDSSGAKPARIVILRAERLYLIRPRLPDPHLHWQHEAKSGHLTKGACKATTNKNQYPIFCSLSSLNNNLHDKTLVLAPTRSVNWWHPEVTGYQWHLLKKV